MRSPSREVVLVTCPQHPELPPDDRLLLAPLRAAGLEPRILSWDDPNVRWQDHPRLVLRAPWDYHLRLTAFLDWLSTRAAEGAQILNPPDTVRWNSDKRYLRDLETRGIPIVPTSFLEPGDTTPLREILRERGWDEAVLKPAISAGAHQTLRLLADASVETLAAAERIRVDIQRRSAVMLQPFLAEVQEEGEWSFFYFDRRFSHLVQKRPAAGDFRVQAEFGGVNLVPPAPPGFLAAAEKVIAAVEGPLLYARVDAIPVQGRLLLGELELIEPSLFLAESPEAPGRFTRALEGLLQ